MVCDRGFAMKLLLLVLLASLGLTLTVSFATRHTDAVYNLRLLTVRYPDGLPFFCLLHR